MDMIERLGLRALHCLDPEAAHGLSLRALQAGLVPLAGLRTDPRLAVRIADLDLPNPVGLAAGFDKDAVAIAPLSRAGFGFIELGAVTPRPQPGNPRPRLFRLNADRGVINRFGFNNAGAAAAAARLARRVRGPVPVGINLGANKDSGDRAGDFAHVLTICGPHVDFATVNVSSPNTERLRDLQGPAALAALLERVMAARADLPQPVPVFLKVAPDLDSDEIAAIAEVALTSRIAGIIATNTTLARDGLRSRDRDQAGGLSGAPLFERSTRVLARFHQATGGQLPLIGVGGINSAADALAKIRAGASAVQLYTALVFEGLSLVDRIAAGLAAAVTAAGVDSISDLTGTETGKWT